MKRIFLLLLCCLGLAHAFPINPYVSGSAAAYEKSPKYFSLLKHISDPTHESLSRLAYRCAANRKDGNAACSGPADTGIAGIDRDALIWGTHWNDDPNNFMRDAAGAAIWLGWMNGAALHKSEIDTGYVLQYRSHYGDLQILHAMGTAKSYSTAAAVQNDIENWLHFAYDVATRRISPDTRLGQLAATQPFVHHFDGKAKANWTVRKLFTNYCDEPATRAYCHRHAEIFDATDQQLAAIALGALLHTIQDSYSASHVERVAGTGPVKAWLDYTLQDARCHQTSDFDIPFIGTTAAQQHPAVVSGNWLITSVLANTPWDDVAKHLHETVFAKAPTQNPPNPGKCPIPPSPEGCQLTGC